LVSISYSDPDSQTYVSVTGIADVVSDHQKMRELWKPVLKNWFPLELKDPKLALLKISIEKAETWDTSSNKMVCLFEIVRSLSNSEHDRGELNKMNFKNKFLSLLC
jgi:general stress protein 26